MPRIPEDELTRWKHTADLVALMKQDGMALERSGRDWVCRCPFHDDEHPSLRVSPKGRTGKALDLWNCPACHTGGDAVEWLVKFRKLSFRGALEIIMAQAGATTGDTRQVPGTLSGRVGLPCPLHPDMDKAQMLSAVLDYYHQRLLHVEGGIAGRAYLASRGLEDAVAHFGLGVADRTLGLRLPTSDGKAGALIRARLAELGLYRPTTMREHLNGCIVVPIKDAASGEPVKAYGRLLGRPRTVNDPKHLYLSGPHRGILNPQAYALAASPQIGHLVLCEAPLDALTLWANGIKHCCAAWGTQGFTADHLAALRAANVREVRIAFDRDESGDKGAASVAEQLKAEGIACYRVELPAGLDVNAYAQGFKDKEERAEALQQAIRAASFIHGNGPRNPARQENPARKQGEPSAKPVNPAPAVDEMKAVPAAAPSSLAASPSAAAAPSDFQIEHAADFSEVKARFGMVGRERLYRVRGLQHNTGPERLKVLVKAWQSWDAALMHADMLDLAQARARATFVHEAARELGESDGVIKGDVARLFGQLEAMRDGMNAEREDKAKPQLIGGRHRCRLMSARPRWRCFKRPDLLARIVADFAACGMVGEETNKLVGYLAATSRLLARPLAIVVQSSSAAGKSSLLDAVLAMMPDEAQVRYSAMTGQSLYYMGGDSLKNKILAIAEEEGAEQASYSLKLLQSEGKLAIATPSKDAQGQIKTERYEVEGPCSIFLTTTAADVDEELLNRCMVLTVDEDQAQTRRIHHEQRKGETLDGLKAQVGKARTLRLHQNAQRLLESVKVVNPLADKLTFLDGKTRARRDQPKYLSLIRTLALLHQSQRPHLNASGRKHRRNRALRRGDAGRHPGGQPADGGGAGPQPGRVAAAVAQAARLAVRGGEGGKRTSPGPR